MASKQFLQPSTESMFRRFTEETNTRDQRSRDLHLEVVMSSEVHHAAELGLQSIAR